MPHGVEQSLRSHDVIEREARGIFERVLEVRACHRVYHAVNVVIIEQPRHRDLFTVPRSHLGRHGHPSSAVFRDCLARAGIFGWIEDAVLATNDETRQGALRRAGFSPISAQELIRFFHYILGAATDPDTGFSQAIIGFDSDSLAAATAYNGNIQPTMFGQVRDPRHGALSGEEGSDAEGSASSGQTFDQVIADGDAEAVEDFISISCEITAQLARLISVDAVVSMRAKDPFWR
jgi:hypothetical protein